MASRVELKDIKKAWKAASDIPKSQKSKKGKAYKYLRGLIGKLTPQQREALKNERAIKFAMGAAGKWWAKQASVPARQQRTEQPDQPSVNPYTKTAPKQAITKNKNKIKDKRYLSGSRDHAHLSLDGRKVTLTGNHLEQTPRNQRRGRGAHGVKASRQTLDAQGNLIRHARGKVNYGWDYTPWEKEKFNRDKHEYYEGTKSNGEKYRIPLRSPVAGKVVHIEQRRKPTLAEQVKFHGRRLSSEELELEEFQVYPTGWGHTITIETGEVIEKNGKVFPVYATIAHATPDSFEGLRVGDHIKADEKIGYVGGQGKRVTDRKRYGNHIDFSTFVKMPGKGIAADAVRGDVFKDRVYVSPSFILSNKIDDKGVTERAGVRETKSIMAKPKNPEELITKETVEETTIETPQSQEMQIFNKETVEEQETPPSQEMQHFNRETDVPQDKNTEQKLTYQHGRSEEDWEEQRKENEIEGKGLLKDLVDKPSVNVKEEIEVKEEVGPQFVENMDMVDEYKMRKGSQSLRGAPLDVMEPQHKPTPKYKTFEKGGAVFKEPELSDDPKMRARQTGETDIIDEAVEDKVEGTVPTPQDAWRLKPEEPKKPKPPVEASIKGDTVVLTKQEQVDDVDKMSVVELKDKLQETKEVVSEPNSDTVTLQSRPSQVQKARKLKAELDKRKQWAEESSDAAVKVGIRETPGRMGQSQVDVTEKVKVTEEADPKAVSIYDIFRSSEGITEEARLTLKDELNKASEVEQNLQKIEPMRFWNTMSTPAKIVAGIGMLIGGYYGTKSAAGTQAIMDVIDGAVNADISAQKLTRDQQLSTAKEATRRAKAAVDKYTAMATSPDVRAKLASLAQALDIKKAGIEKTQQIQHLKHYVMNEARAGRLHLVPPAIMRLVYPKEEMKRIDTLRENFEKERKDRKIAPTISAYRRLHNLIASDQKISGADDISIVFQFMKMLDPNSVVREGEFKTAEGAGPRAEYFARQWNRMWNGGRFVESDRKAFLQSALKMIKPAMDDEKDLQRKYVSMARRYGYPAAFIISPSVRYFDLPGTKDEAGIRKIMKEQGKTREEASDIHYQVRRKVKSSFYLP